MATIALQQTESLIMLPQDDIDGLNIAHVDSNVLDALPNVEKVLDVADRGISAWAKTYRISIQHTDGSQADYFMKVSMGHHGREALKGEFTSTLAIHNAIPGFCPKPIAWGTFESNPDAHFYVCKFHEFYEGLPDPETFCKNLARLHKTESPNGKFGFECVTYNQGQTSIESIESNTGPCHSIRWLGIRFGCSHI